jgi:hypothetical protein
MFARQTRKGRAIPLYFDIIIYPVKKGSQNIFIINAINNFLKIIKPVKVKFVFDRGFSIPDLIMFLAEIKATFYIRIKGSKQVAYEGTTKQAKDFTEGKYEVNAYRLDLALTVTPRPEHIEDNEPWYIISNDKVSSQEEIQENYYYRFEIEEMFKDAKRIFGMEYVRFKLPHNFKTALWFTILGIWFHHFLEEEIQEAKTEAKKCKDSVNQGISHFWMEKIELCFRLEVLAKISTKSG